MPYRWTLCSLSLLLTVSPASAHHLFVRYQVLPGQRVQILGYYGPDDFAEDAIVAVYRPDGRQLGERGVMNAKGVYVFSFREVEDLKVFVTHDGHKKELPIPAAELAKSAPPAPKVDNPQAAASGPLANGNSPDQEVQFPLWEIVAGLSLVLALAALYLSARTAQRVRELQRLALPPLVLTPAPPALPAPKTAVTAVPPATGTPRPRTLPTGPAPG
jgi:hypothetical protein